MLASLLSGGLAGCGVTSEVTTTHPSTASVSTAQPVAPSTGQYSAAGEGRPRRLPDGTLPEPRELPSAAVVLAPSAATAASSASTRSGGEVAPDATSPTPAPSAGAVVSRNMRTQSGRIIDEAGEPLVGATVLLKGTTRGASTDANGNYSLAVPLGTNTFVFGYSGYQDEVAQSRDGQPITVTLLPAPAAEAVAKDPKPRTRRKKG
ncbi:MAG: carboxypeptidase-like regulatory domain-containing protein [Janthinobacterium lividum]